MKALVELLVGARRGLDEAIAKSDPEECCALVFRGPSGLALELVPNVADAMHAADPESFPRNARRGYAIEVRNIIAAERRGLELVAIVHSHPEGGTGLSAEDLRLATAPNGGPSWPGVAQVVLDGSGGRFSGFEVHAWDITNARFEAVARWADGEPHPGGNGRNDTHLGR